MKYISSNVSNRQRFHTIVHLRAHSYTTVCTGDMDCAQGETFKLPNSKLFLHDVLFSAQIALPGYVLHPIRSWCDCGMRIYYFFKNIISLKLLK